MKTKITKGNKDAHTSKEKEPLKINNFLRIII